MLRLTTNTGGIPETLRRVVLETAINLNQDLLTRTERPYWPTVFNRTCFAAHMSRKRDDNGNNIRPFWRIWIQYEPSIEHADLGGIDVVHNIKFAIMPGYVRKDGNGNGYLNGYFLTDEASQKLFHALDEQTQQAIIELIRKCLIPKIVQVLSEFALEGEEDEKEKAWHYLFSYSSDHMIWRNEEAM